MATTEHRITAVSGESFRKCVGTDQFFKEALESTASFNTRLNMERTMRLPFLDSHTGVAQNNTTLMRLPKDRRPGKQHGQIYSYPTKKWKRTIPFFWNDNHVKEENETTDGNSTFIETGENDLHQISAVENPALKGTDLPEGEFKADPSVAAANSKDAWYDDYDMFDDPPDAGEMVDDQSDISDYEDTIKKRKRKTRKDKGEPRTRKKREEKEGTPSDDKPFGCDLCVARYKTRPGLAYHYTHFHNGVLEGGDDELAMAETPSKPYPTRSRHDLDPDKTVDKYTPSNYCDFCLGDQDENKKTHEAEELVSCSDCGRSGHPSCLQFTDNMIVSVKKYPWQCIECKSCGLCGTSDNDDQLLFCDDCDRGYHMYCLKPPLESPPEGNWSCYLCIEEFHAGKKPAGMN